MNTADRAIALVLQAEADARRAIAAAESAAAALKEVARLEAHARRERTDARLRSLIAAFERDVAARTAALDAQAAGLAQPEPPDARAQIELERAVARLARVRELTGSRGADVVVDYTKQRFEDELSDYDGAFDLLGGDDLHRTFRVVKPGGQVVSVAGMPEPLTARKDLKRGGLLPPGRWPGTRSPFGPARCGFAPALLDRSPLGRSPFGRSF